MTRVTQVIILGASGDLTARKLIPALAGLALDQELKGRLQVVGVARRPQTSSLWRDEITATIEPAYQEGWSKLAPHVEYVEASATDARSLKNLRVTLNELAQQEGELAEDVGRLYYLALKPALFADTVAALDEAGLLEEVPGRGWRRVLCEKPFGTDRDTAKSLNTALGKYLREDQTYRIDHYLGKETVQNILAWRFHNAILEPLWNRNHIESVEITACETVGMEGGRGGYYDTSGAVRDMLQNHLLQLLALVAMEPPTSMDSKDIRDEKVKVLRALKVPSAQEVGASVVRAQYSAGDGHPGYLEEEGVATDSDTESFFALKTYLPNWRWEGVPFYIRTGKRMHRRYLEVVLRFRTPPVKYGNSKRELKPNSIRMLIQPEQGIRLNMLVKRPGPKMKMSEATLGFDYSSLRAGSGVPAYQRLLRDALEGQQALFMREDEVDAAWAFVDGLRAAWEGADLPMHTYAAGSTGPTAQDHLWEGVPGGWTNGEESE